jgi:hypothetical protein
MAQSFQIPVEIRSRTFTKLLALDQSSRKRFSNQVAPGLECLGLRIAPELSLSGYFCSPVNAIQFANNGAEALFSFMIFGGQINDSTPIVLTCVGAGEQHNFIVGKSLHEFLCLGYYRGFFVMEQLGYHTDRMLRRLTAGRWKPRLKADWGFGVSDEHRPVLKYVRRRLKLRPWRDPVRKFAALQRTYLPHLELRMDMFSKGWVDDEFRAWKKWFAKNASI